MLRIDTNNKKVITYCMLKIDTNTNKKSSTDAYIFTRCCKATITIIVIYHAAVCTIIKQE